MMTAKMIVRKKEYELPAGQSIKDAILKLGLQPESYLAMRNGEMVVETEMLRDGDVVKLIAVISGGCGRP